MGHISKTEVDRIAELARLDLTDSEKDVFEGQLNQILGYVAQVESVPTEGVPPTSSVADNQSEWRRDEVLPGLSPDEALANAPESQDGLFRVPTILGK